MRYIYPQHIEAAQTEIAQLKDYIGKIQQEIAFLEEQYKGLS